MVQSAAEVAAMLGLAEDDPVVVEALEAQAIRDKEERAKLRVARTLGDHLESGAKDPFANLEAGYAPRGDAERPRDAGGQTARPAERVESAERVERASPADRDLLGVARGADPDFWTRLFESGAREAAAAAPRPLARSAGGPARRPLREDAVRDASPRDEAQVVQAEQDAHELEESDGGGPALEHLDSRVPLDARAAGSVVARIERVRDERGETA